MKGAGTGVDADPFRRADVMGELLLEGRDLVTEHELPAVQDQFDGRRDLRFEKLVLRFQVH